MAYRCRHFKLWELVDQATYSAMGEKAWLLFDNRALETLDWLRDTYGPVVVNDWKAGGKFQYSGFRPEHCIEGAKHSQHKYGRAFDCKFREISADQVRADLIARPGRAPLMTAIEVPSPGHPMSWFHFDTRNATALQQFPAR